MKTANFLSIFQTKRCNSTWVIPHYLFQNLVQKKREFDRLNRSPVFIFLAPPLQNPAFIMDGQFMATMTRLALNLVMFTCLARPTIAHFCMYSALLYCNSSTLPPSFEFVGCCFFKYSWFWSFQPKTLSNRVYMQKSMQVGHFYKFVFD